MLKKQLFLLFVLTAIVMASCSKHQRLMKSSDFNAKLEAADKYYAKSDYYRALQLYDELIIVFRGTEKSERIYYNYAMCHYHQKDYTMASYHFKYFARNYPKSTHTEECLFLSAYCKYLESPTSSLDQSFTLEALQEMQLFINMYPSTSRMQQCNEIIDKLRLKLQTKDFDIAMLYLNIEDYKAAIYALNAFMKDHPASSYREEVMFNLVKAWVSLAEVSVMSKRDERYRSAIDAFGKFSAAYPESRFMREANAYQRQAQKMISEVKN